jgi:DNA-directed RNA polymerase subunit B
MIDIQDRWEIIKSYFRSKGLVRQHLDSYNEFVQKVLQQIIDEQGEIVTEIPGLKVKLGKIRVDKPSVREADRAVVDVTPMEARLRNLSYSAPIRLIMTPVENNIEGEPEEVYIGELPVML